MGAKLRIFYISLLVLALPLSGQGSKKSTSKISTSSAPEQQSMPTDLQGCAAIKDNKQRLAAFDNLAKTQKATASSFKTEERQAAQDAMKALRKVQTATKVGLNKADYGKQVIEMAQIVEESLATLPECALKQVISEARDRYVDAQGAWDRAHQTEYIEIFFMNGVGKKLYDEYGLRPKDLSLGGGTGSLAKITYTGGVLHPLWSAAGRRVLVGSELLKRNLPKDASALEYLGAIDKLERATRLGEPTEELKKSVPNWMGLADKPTAE